MSFLSFIDIILFEDSKNKRAVNFSIIDGHNYVLFASSLLLKRCELNLLFPLRPIILCRTCLIDWFIRTQLRKFKLLMIIRMILFVNGDRPFSWLISLGHNGAYVPLGRVVHRPRGERRRKSIQQRNFGHLLLFTDDFLSCKLGVAHNCQISHVSRVEFRGLN